MPPGVLQYIRYWQTVHETLTVFIFTIVSFPRGIYHVPQFQNITAIKCITHYQTWFCLCHPFPRKMRKQTWDLSLFSQFTSILLIFLEGWGEWLIYRRSLIEVLLQQKRQEQWNPSITLAVSPFVLMGWGGLGNSGTFE